MFDFITEEHTMIQQAARDFAQRSIAPIAEHHDETGEFPIDTVRQMGADPATSKDDPKVKELVDEIVHLSTEFGILTEYTAFLAREGTDLGNRPEVLREAEIMLEARAMRSRSGLDAVNQSLNLQPQLQQKSLNYGNVYFNDKMERVSIATVQQINDRAFYRRGNRWVESVLVDNEMQVTPARVIEFDSEEFIELAQRLAITNRQGSIALGGDVLLLVDGEPVLIKTPAEN